MKKLFVILFSLVLSLSLIGCVVENPNPDDGGDNPPDVKPDDKFSTIVYSVSLSDTFVSFDSNRSEKENKRTEFMDRSINYIVGDDNPWSVKPEITFVLYNEKTGEIKPTNVEKWSYQIRLYILEGSEYVLLEDPLEHVDCFDLENCTIDFSQKAIGNSYKVEVTPDGLTDTQKEPQNISKYVKTFECDVIDGYNAYTALDLAYVEARNDASAAESAWKEFKTEKGLDLNYCPNAIILHDDIKVTAEDVPAYFFYTADEVSRLDADYDRVVGSMKDYEYFYLRNYSANANETFSLYGNYFTIDNSSLREVVRENGKITTEGEVISHSAMFKFEGDETTHITFNSINIIGNAPRVENAIKGGGQILIKVQGVGFEAYNNITICMFITYFTELATAEQVIEKCRVYDAFNSFIYNWGSANVKIKSSEMIGCGGPVIIQDHTYATSADGGNVPGTIIENSVLESYVAGSEGWFSLVGATGLVPGIKSMDKIFNLFGRSFLKTDSKESTVTYFNFIAINKSGSAQSVTAEKVKGSIVIDDAVFDYGASSNPYLAAMLDVTFEQGAPAFQSSASSLTSGYAYTDGVTGLYDVQNQLITDPTNALFSGDYLTIYYQGMALVFGYYTVNQQLTK